MALESVVAILLTHLNFRHSRFLILCIFRITTIYIFVRVNDFIHILCDFFKIIFKNAYKFNLVKKFYDFIIIKKLVERISVM